MKSKPFVAFSPNTYWLIRTNKAIKGCKTVLAHLDLYFEGLDKFLHREEKPALTSMKGEVAYVLNGRYHSTVGPAYLYYEVGGWAIQYSVHGVKFNKEDWDKIYAI